MKINKILVMLMLSVILFFTSQSEWSFATIVEQDVALFDSKIILDGETVTNKDMFYPIIKYEENLYFPVSNLDLVLLGYKAALDSNTNTIKLEKTEDTRQVDPNDVEPIKSIKGFAKSDIQVVYNGKTIGEEKAPVVECFNIIYIPFNLETFNKLGIFAQYDKELGLILDTRGLGHIKDYIDENADQPDDKVAAVIKRINPRVSKVQAADYTKYIQQASEKYKIDPLWLTAMIWQESRFNASSVGGGAYGMMQIMESTGRGMGVNRQELLKPDVSIALGAKYLSNLVTYYNGNLKKATLAYNQGSGNVNRGTYKTWYLEDIEEKYKKLQRLTQ